MVGLSQVLDRLEEGGLKPNNATWLILLDSARYLKNPDIKRQVCVKQVPDPMSCGQETAGSCMNIKLHSCLNRKRDCAQTLSQLR